jgi:hypothetical protein
MGLHFVAGRELSPRTRNGRKKKGQPIFTHADLASPQRRLGPSIALHFVAPLLAGARERIFRSSLLITSFASFIFSLIVSRMILVRLNKFPFRNP